MGSLGDGGSSIDGGKWHAAGEQVRSAREYGDSLQDTVGMFFAKFGWTIVAVLVIWYNVHDPIKERLAKWRNERAIADANRPERRSVLDRERMRAVAAKQEEVLAAARAAADEQAQRKQQRYEASPTFKKDA